MMGRRYAWDAITCNAVRADELVDELDPKVLHFDAFGMIPSIAPAILYQPTHRENDDERLPHVTANHDRPVIPALLTHTVELVVVLFFLL
jgi:hypothetical protein